MFSFPYISRWILGLSIICMPLLYSEDPSQVNQLHSSQKMFEVSESIPAQTKSPIQASIVAENVNFKAGQPFWVMVSLDIEKNWNVYWKNPGDTGMPVSIDWDLPSGFTAEDILWPYPERMETDSFIGFGYENQVHLLTRIVPPSHVDVGNYPVKATIRYLACSDSSCLPGENEVQMNLAFTEKDAQTNASLASLFDQVRQTLPQSGWNFKAQRLNDLIELVAESPAPLSGQIVKAHFFPEQGQSIDYHVDAIISEGASGSYSIALKETDTLARSSYLKGVLVLTNGSKQEALEVSIPIIDKTGGDVLLTANDPTPGLNIQLPLEDEFDGGLWMALAMAFVGGMILNLMPCVLPVMSFKILSFVKMAGQSRKLTLQHGLVFCAGVMISFWVLAGALLILQAYGHAVGWGFQLQEPIFVAILAAILFIFSLSLFGVFEMGVKVGSMAGQLHHQTAKEGMASSFMSGVLATLIATPCTGPFLGTAVGFAMTQPYYFSLLIFTFLGAGMAFPYLLLSAYPQLMRFLPKPGAWMDTFKQLMGFLMLASVLWLVWVFAAQTSSLAIVMFLAALFVMSLGCWIYGRWGTPLHSKRSRLLSMIVAALLIAGGFYALTSASEGQATSATEKSVAVAEGDWEEFSPERLAELKAKGIPVFIDFTAKWCLICQANHMILTASDVHAKFNEKGVVRMKADWTKKDAVITEELRKFGRNSVPLYVLYNGEEKPVILPQVLSPSVVIEQIKTIQ